MRFLALLALLTLTPSARAAFDRIIALDAGLGFPQIAAVGGAVRAHPWLQLGFGYGYLPSSLVVRPQIQINPVILELATGFDYMLEARDTSSLGMMTPYIRVFPFPSRDQFYVQVAYSMLTVYTTIVNDLVRVGNSEDRLDDAVTFRIQCTLPIPTFSVGHLFMSQLFFINVNIGASILLLPTTTTSVTTALPSVVGGDAINAQYVAEAAAEVDALAKNLVSDFRRSNPILPSLFLSVGFFL